MNKQKIISTLKALNIVLILALGFIFLLGAPASIPAIFTSGVFQIAMLGYLIAIIFGLLAFKKSYFLAISLIGWMVFGLANSVDMRQMAEENNKLCQELRADPTCKEDECGFRCAKITTGGSICKDKDMSLCRPKR